MEFIPTKFKQLLLTFFFMLPALCQAQLDFDFRNGKAGFQTGPNFLAYEGGFFEVTLVDGSVAVSPCADSNPSPGVVLANPFCSLGTNSYIVGFGESAGLTGHWSLSAAPTGAQYIAVNRPDLFQLLSAPPSLLSRPQVLPRIDRSLSIGYSYLAAGYTQYRVAEYVHRQTFLPTPAGRTRHDETLPHNGVYIFGYPQIQTTAQIEAGLPPAVIPVPVESPFMPESYPGPSQSPVDSGFRFINGRKKPDGTRTAGYWNDGMIELDPVFEMPIEWEGFLAGVNINVAVDSVSLWMESTRSLTPLETPVADNVIYPIPGLAVPYEIPAERILLGVETLPPFYFAWTAGDEVVLYLRMDRNTGNTSAVKDTSYRVWGLPIRFVTTFSGFAFTELPANTPDKMRSAKADFDDDGFSNFLEYAANTDPDDILSSPPLGFPLLISNIVAGKQSATIDKRPNVGGSLLYDMEWSSDMITWTSIAKVGDPTWDVVETGTALTATAKVAGVPAVAFLRAKLTLVH